MGSVIQDIYTAKLLKYLNGGLAAESNDDFCNLKF